MTKSKAEKRREADRARKYARRNHISLADARRVIVARDRYGHERYLKRKRKPRQELSFFGITAKDLNMNPNRRR